MSGIIFAQHNNTRFEDPGLPRRISMISTIPFRTSLIAAVFGAILLLHPAASVHSQKADAFKFQHAVSRSADAARILALLAVAPETDLPKEIADRAEAIGVFPKVVKETVMFNSFSKGYGVISARTEHGWTLPAFYSFQGGGYGNPFANTETYAVLLFFMTGDSLKWFEKGGVELTNRQKALEGPIKTVTDDQRKELADAHILAYAYYNGKLNGTSFGKSFWKSFALNPDNNINSPVYGVKGREVLAGAKIDPANVLSGIPEYQATLVKYYGR
jgi:lipid-binding SYLF domain-containing protein